MNGEAVYFVRDGEAVKIGRSVSVVGRVRALECANSQPLEVLAIISGDAETEARLHERFKGLNIRGEWFRYEPELQRYIEALCAQGDTVTIAKKRGYSRDFTPQTERRVRFEVDRIPPTLYDAVKAKAKRKGISLRALTLGLWKDWVDDDGR